MKRQGENEIVNGSNLWTKNYIRLLGITLLLFTVRQMLASTFPQFVGWAGGTTAQAGMITLILTGAAIAMRLFSGGLADRWGKTQVMKWGSLCFILSLVVMALFPQMEVIIFCQVLQGIGYAAVTTAAGAAVADVVPQQRIGEGLGYYALGNSIAMAIGPSLGIWSTDVQGFRLMLWMAASLIGAVFCLQMGIRYRSESTKDRLKGKNQWIEKRALAPAALQFIVVFGFTSVLSYLTSYAQQAGFQGVGAFFSIYAGGMILVRLVVGRLTDRIPELMIVLVAFVLMTVAFIGITQSKSTIGLYPFAVLLGLGQGVAMPTLNKMAVKQCDPAHRGAATATYQLAADLATGVGAAFWGAFIEWSSYKSIYYGAAGSSLLGLAGTGLLLLLKRKRREGM